MGFRLNNNTDENVTNQISEKSTIIDPDLARLATLF